MSDEEQSNNQESKRSGLAAFWSELKRRKIFRVASVYIITGWIIIQVASATFSDFGIPIWAYRFVVLMVALGFPLAVILAWAFELTPEGIKTTQTAREEHAESAHRSAVPGILQATTLEWVAIAFSIQP